MAERVSTNVSLTPELQKFIEERVKSGRYQSASEVVRAALRVLQDEEREREAALEHIREQIREGLEAAERGEHSDGEEFFRELEREEEEFNRKRKTA